MPPVTGFVYTLRQYSDEPQSVIYRYYSVLNKTLTFTDIANNDI